MKMRVEYDPWNPKYPFSHESETDMFHKLCKIESEYMPSIGYCEDKNKIQIRSHLIPVISSISHNADVFHPHVWYVAVTYLDRFLSKTHDIEPVEEDVTNDLKLIGVCCLSIASKMISKYFSVHEFLKTCSSNDVNINLAEIQLTESRILTTLKWDLRAVTALSFLDFLSPFFKLRAPEMTVGFSSHAISKIVLETQLDIKFTAYKPSVIAATALLAASKKSFPEYFDAFLVPVLTFDYIKEADLINCMKGIGIEYKGKGKSVDKAPEWDPTKDAFDELLKMSFDVEKPFLGEGGDESLAEHYYMDSLASSQRRDAIRYLEEYITLIPEEEKDPYVGLLALLYYDKTVSQEPLQLADPDHDLKLYIVSCLLLAWKMRSNVRFLEYLKENFLMEDIVKMELRILSVLKWQLGISTPVSFVSYFTSSLNISNFKRRAINFIMVRIFNDIRFTQFKPSMLAALAILHESRTNNQYSVVRDAIASTPYVTEADLETDLAKLNVRTMRFPPLHAAAESTSSEEERPLEKTRLLSDIYLEGPRTSPEADPSQELVESSSSDMRFPPLHAAAESTSSEEERPLKKTRLLSDIYLEGPRTSPEADPSQGLVESSSSD